MLLTNLDEKLIAFQSFPFNTCVSFLELDLTAVTQSRMTTVMVSGQF